MKNKVRLVVAGVALATLTTIGAGTAAYAHHAFAAEFDADKPVLLKGKVDHVEWVNPHTWIHINVPDVDGAGKAKAGTTFNWAIEGGTPNTLVRTGVNKNSLKAGHRSCGSRLPVEGRALHDRLERQAPQDLDLQGQRP